MTLNIELSAKAEASLRQRAAATGQPVAKYVAELVEQAAGRPALEELLAPVQADFAQSGMTEGELLDLGREFLDEVRDEKAGQCPSAFARRGADLSHSLCYTKSMLYEEPT